jgi:hypothetical protein
MSVNIILDATPIKKTRKSKESTMPKEPKIKEPKEPKEPKDPKKPKVEKVKMPKEKKEQNQVFNENELSDNENKIYKKRGRKPKGGKIVVNPITITTNSMNEHNVILHLKCNQDDLKTAFTLSTDDVIYQPIIQNVENFCFENSSKLSFESIDDEVNNSSYQYEDMKNNANQENPLIIQSASNPVIKNEDETKISNKVLCEKIKELTVNLHNNTLYNKKSDCFWCTFNFDNPPIYIPKYELSGKYFCYGCFCSPECATAFLFKEPIDTSTRFERYHHLNHIYCKIYDYKKNIKPAPDPYYTLNKYYGNLSIQEYRLLLKNERLLIVVEKPLSRVLPELHEDNDELSHSSKSVIYSNKFNLNKKKVQSKTDIIYENFNMK